MRHLTVTVEPSSSITESVPAAIELARQLGTLVAFTFNGVRICAGPESLPGDLWQSYEDGCAAILAKERDAQRLREAAGLGNPLVGYVPKFDTQSPTRDDMREVWNWWNTEATLDTMAKFYEFLKGRNLAR